EPGGETRGGAGPTTADAPSWESVLGGERARPAAGDHGRRTTGAAPQRGGLPAGRDGRSYGPGARDWNPYQPDSVRPIVDHAAAVARRMGYQVEVGDLYQHEADLISLRPPAAPQVLIVDPWALMLPRLRILLERIDTVNAPWVQVVVPWSDWEAESLESEANLRAVLDATLRRKLAEVRRTSKIAGHGIPTLDGFSDVLPRLI